MRFVAVPVFLLSFVAADFVVGCRPECRSAVAPSEGDDDELPVCDNRNADDLGTCTPIAYVESEGVPSAVPSGLEMCSRAGPHRATAEPCAAPPAACSTSSDEDTCAVADDCDGRACVDQGNGCSCVAVCASDDDCDAGEACGCAMDAIDGGIGFYNSVSRCVRATCRDDDDCGAGGVCGVALGVGCDELVGFFCRSDADTCAVDADCPALVEFGPQTCSWTGSAFSCNGPTTCD